jgi:hypothetical protein
MKNNILMLLLSALLVACAQQPAQKQTKGTHEKYVFQYPQKPMNKELTAIQKQKATPVSFIKWLSEADHEARANSYQSFLLQQGVAGFIPQHEFLQSARDWQKCGVSEFEVPPREIWPNIVPTLQIIKQLSSQQVISDYTVTSVYRNFNLNRCAKGAASSRHIFNAAVDFRIGSEFPDFNELQAIEKTKQHLCAFWQEHGAAYNMGLGVYSSGQIHIDSAGYRTWGTDHRNTSSPCSAQPEQPAYISHEIQKKQRLNLNSAL